MAKEVRAIHARLEPVENIANTKDLSEIYSKNPILLCATDSTCTHQDIRNALNTAAAEECNRIEFITVRTHLSRCQIMFELQAAKRRSAPPSEFLASEEILSRQNSKYCNLFRFLESLPAAHNTRTMEAIGVTKLRLGTYVFI
jgi:superfamily II DNA helicase RecQ